MKNQRKKPLIVAIVGKGGVGKTIVTTLIAKAISISYNFKLLLIDADPTHPHLSKMVNLLPEKSLEMVRAELINKTINKKKDIQTLAENIDFEVYSAIKESKDFSLFSIGSGPCRILYIYSLSPHTVLHAVFLYMLELRLVQKNLANQILKDL